ncbi:blastula protease 10-like [Lingula anatina]|uniref:Metalloendopeptidase n=1 Tax=Lingula anatina TaxID=7574 RepID=A0A1S3K5V1_LINAN|nr:blastula protease 10-like [Lingula anatina]|eukprot:XP_013417809.2 blastula protease 10-like [Lingula anatina]
MRNAQLSPRVAVAALIAAVCAVWLSEVSHAKTIDELIKSAAKKNKALELFQDDNVVLRELDILELKKVYLALTRAREEEFGPPDKNDNDREKRRRKKRKGIRDRRLRWTNNIVPYTISSVMTASDRTAIQQAFNDWNTYTCIQFKPRTNERNYIHLQNGAGCSSYVGMLGRGQQPVNLARGCRSKGIIIHELGHAIGFNHEQTRYDRRKYVTILRKNIPEHLFYNFRRYPKSYTNTHGLPYDYDSVMHYGQYAFSTNGRRTIITKDKTKQNTIGNRFGLSFGDVKLANAMYRCDSGCTNKPRCPSPGFVDKNCRCSCPGTRSGVPVQPCG